MVAAVLGVDEDWRADQQACRNTERVRPWVVRVKDVGPELPEAAGEAKNAFYPAAGSESLDLHAQLLGDESKGAWNADAHNPAVEALWVALAGQVDRYPLQAAHVHGEQGVDDTDLGLGSGKNQASHTSAIRLSSVVGARWTLHLSSALGDA
jgi:hypothetical protein